MKRFLAILVVCGFAGVALALNIPAERATASTPPAGKFIVHEWGTFTGFAGSDGVHLPFGTFPGNDLPAFVFDRREQAVRLKVKLNDWDVFSKGSSIYTLQRMETPVVYFYTDQPRDVSVAVDFPQGLLTDFYPPVRVMTPAFGDGPGEYHRIQRPPLPPDAKPTTPPAAKFERSSLDWGTIRLIPQAADKHPAYMPEVPKTPEAAAHYQYARETDAATVQFSDRADERHDERFLFYRGLGDFTLPVTLKSHADDRFEVTNTAVDPIAFALLLRITDGRARFAVYRDITGRQPMTLPSEAESVSPGAVGDEIVRALVAEGLFEKEARAMVKTWSSTWLGDAGTRVLYSVPRAVTDTMLPLRISPAPDETVRVLIGRIDVMSPQDEAKVQSLLATSLQTKTLPPADAAYLRNFARFIDPALERAARLRKSPEAKSEIQKLRSLFWNAPKPQPAPPAGGDADAVSAVGG